MTEPFKPVGVTFLRAMAPYQAGDIAGLLHDHAHDLVQRRIADFYPPTADTAVSAAGPVEPAGPLAWPPPLPRPSLGAQPRPFELAASCLPIRRSVPSRSRRRLSPCDAMISSPVARA